MAFVSDMVDQLRDFLTDTGDAQVTIANKKLYLNRGITRLWPQVFRVFTYSVAATAAMEYAMPAAMGNGSVLSVEVETASASGVYFTLQNYELVPGDATTVSILKLLGGSPPVGGNIRVRYNMPCTQIVGASYAAMQSETWVGPAEALGLPVIYAMGLISLRTLDDRHDYTRLSTTQGQSADDQDLLTTAQVYFAQFEIELEALGKQFARYLPDYLPSLPKA